jgi:hypothetical protein
MLPDLSGLPAFAQVIIYGSTGIGVVFAYFIGHAGFKHGMKSSPNESNTQVAAMIIDPVPLRAATAAIEAMNMSFVEHNILLRENNRMLNDIAVIGRQLTVVLDDVREEIKFTREVSRR